MLVTVGKEENDIGGVTCVSVPPPLNSSLRMYSFLMVENDSLNLIGSVLRK